MSKILDAISELLIETVSESNGYTSKQTVERLVPDDSFVFLNLQPTTDDSPAEESPSLATLRRNMNRNKEIDKK